MNDKDYAFLIRDMFNLLTLKQKRDVPKELRERITKAMEENGFRFVFHGFYLQPDSNNGDKDERK